jgi:Kef-type K+ transport system membrane component KefB
MSTIIIFASLMIGIVIGASQKLPKKLVKYNDLFTFIGVLVLLFVMGLSLGMKVELKDLRALGYQSLVFTGLTVFFSILIVYLFAKWFIKEKKS